MLRPDVTVSRASARRPAPRLVSVATALPPHVVRQQDARDFAEHLFREVLGETDRRLLAVFDNTGIERRHVCMPLDWYGEPHDFGVMNACYQEQALALAAEVIPRVLEPAGLTAADVDHLVFVSSTGIATPSLDARIANRLPFRSNFRRTPVWGLGCAGGASGLARARDFALAHPESRVLLVAVELCSLTFQRGDRTSRNLVAASLFSDGAAAALILGAEADVPRRPPQRPLAMVDARSTLWPDTLDVMGWDVDAAGLHVVFSRDIPTLVRERVRPNLEEFLAGCGLSLPGLEHLVAHPGGPKVLAAYADALDRPAESFRHAHEVLRDCGNMSSPTCLFVLERTLAAGAIGDGEHAVLTALGPGFSSELVLLRGLKET
jgi:alkylresorcinol/alkylpyrone synthase